MYIMQRIGYFLLRDTNQKFELFKLACTYKQLYLDVEDFKKVINAFCKNEQFKKDFLEFVDLLIKNKIIIDMPIVKLLEDNVGKIPQGLNTEQLYYYLYVKEAIKRESCLITLKSFDSLNKMVIAEHFKSDTELLKSSFKFKEVGLFILDTLNQNFYVKKENYSTFIDIIKNNSFFNLKIKEYVDDFKGYRLLDSEIQKLNKSIEEEKQKLKVAEKSILDSYATEIGTDTVGLMIPLPLGFAKFLISKGIRKIKIKKEKLEWLIYLLALTSFYQKPKTTEERCKICELSLSEIEELSEKECEKIVFGNKCMSHMVIYLNLKRLRRSAKQFLSLIKENEDDPLINFNTKLGSFE